MKPRLLGWFLLSLLIGILSIFFYSRRVDAPELANDSYQYLDAASHLSSGDCLCTDVAHFDEQVRWGRMPVPFTHFGPGYPVAIAALELVRIPGETAGFLLSAGAYLMVICLIWVTCLYIELQPWSIALICIIWSLNPIALRLAVSVGADSLFTAVVMGLCFLIAYDIRHITRPRPFSLLGMGVLVGAAYWLRQPGLFLLLPLCLYLVWRCAGHPAGRLFALLAAAVAVLGFTPVILHNIIYAHSWNSGFANGRHTPWKEVVADTLKAPYHIFFGVATPAGLTVWSALLVLSTAVIIWIAFSNYRRGLPFGRLREAGLTVFTWLLILAVTFALGILAAEFSTYAADEVRYNFPVFPIVLIACAVLFQVAGNRTGRVAAILCVLSVAMIDGHSLAASRLADQSSLPADLLQQQVQAGESMQTFLRDNVPAGSVLVATDGQAVYYLLKRPVVSIIEPQYSLHTWNEADVQSVMRSFGAQYFLLFPGAGRIRAPEQHATPFLLALTEGHPPPWLSVAARTQGAILYRCAACSHAPFHSS